MKTKKPNQYKEIIDVLKELKTLYPATQMGKHLSTIMDEYGDFWGISDQQLLAAFKKYKAQMQIVDVPRGTFEDEDVENIVQDAMDLRSDTLYSEED